MVDSRFKAKTVSLHKGCLFFGHQRLVLINYIIILLTYILFDLTGQLRFGTA